MNPQSNMPRWLAWVIVVTLVVAFLVVWNLLFGGSYGGNPDCTHPAEFGC